MPETEKKGQSVRGFVRGVLWGGVTAAAGLVVVSQLAGPPAGTDEATVGQAEPAMTAPAIAPKPERGGEAPAVAFDPPEAPVASVVQAAPEMPDGAAEVRGPQTAPPAPSAPTDDALAAAPPAPAEPPVAPPSDAPATQVASAEVDGPPVPPKAAAAPLTAPVAAAPEPLAVGKGEVAPSSVDLPPPPPLTPEEEALLMPPPDRGDLPPAAPQDPVTALPVDPTPEPVAPPEPMAEPKPEPTSEPQTATVTPRPSRPEPTPGVVTGRLPQIGGAAPAESDPAAQAEAGAADPTLDESLPPLQRYARAFDNAAQKPLFAIVLQDNGQDGVNRQELAALEMPLSIVIDPLSDGAADRAAIWRAGGQEVIMAGRGIPQGATPGDLEQSFQVLASRLPEAVAVIDTDGESFQNNRPLATQLVAILAAQGRGLVTLDRGLNAADQVARRESVASARVFRTLDAEGEAGPLIRRYLDRAAFKAAQEGRVVVLGNLRPETIAGIMEWAVEGRASTVALAPITAVMAPQPGP
ncbi:MAG: divergent polysaccharide deacetylase family protein [Rhodobacteraceae bacterium]|nr:divergent polysaccharide deacetylase family protein [Paracoccaceae bacterium]